MRLIPRSALRMLLAALSGVLTNLAFPDAGIWPLAILGLMGLLWAVEGQPARFATILGVIWGLGFFLPHLWWSAVATDPVPWLALSGLQASFVALFGFLYGLSGPRLNPNPDKTASQHSAAIQTTAVRLLLVAPVLWTATELLRSRVPFGGFPWGRLGFSQADSPLGRFAWLGGVSLVSFVCVLLAGLLLLAAMRLSAHTWNRAQWRPVAALTVILALIYLAAGLIPLANNPESGSLNLALVQGNVDRPGQTGQAQNVLDNHIKQSVLAKTAAMEADFPIDLYIWPEDAVGFDLSTDPTAVTQLQAIVDELETPVLLGTQEYPPDAGRYNISTLWEPGVGETGRYTKQLPVPFGEYIPLRGFFRLFSKQVDRVNTDMLAGEGPAFLEFASARMQRQVALVPVICFEIAYERISRTGVQLGGELVVVQTNNANFGYTAESTQQFAMTRLTAISTGRSAVQVSTVGVSGAVLPNGEVVGVTELFEPGYLLVDLPLRQSLTPAVRLGFWLEVLIGLGSVVTVSLGVIGRGNRPVKTSQEQGE